jgi:hypothetical protein
VGESIKWLYDSVTPAPIAQPGYQTAQPRPVRAAVQIFRLNCGGTTAGSVATSSATTAAPNHGRFWHLATWMPCDCVTYATNIAHCAMLSSRSSALATSVPRRLCCSTSMLVRMIRRGLKLRCWWLPAKVLPNTHAFLPRHLLSHHLPQPHCSPYRHLHDSSGALR